MRIWAEGDDVILLVVRIRPGLATKLDQSSALFTKEVL